MRKLIVLLFVSVAAFAAKANPDGFFMFAVHSPGELPTPESYINGMRLSAIYGDCTRLNGFDLSLSGTMRERMNGLQIGILFSLNGADMNGLGIGCVNYAGGEFAGCQIGLWNHAFSGAGTQLGIVNTANYFAGFQCGLFNWAENLDGLQLGLSNVVADQACPWLPILNVGW